MRRALKQVVAGIQRRGVFGLAARFRSYLETRRRYRRWIAAHDTLTPPDRERLSAEARALDPSPLISVVMPVYNTPERWLVRAVDSVRGQLYPRWELCIADDASSAAHVRPLLAAWAAADPRMKLVLRERNGHIAAASNSALALARGEFVALLDHDDELHPEALLAVARELASHPDADVVYTDEDKLDLKGARYDPYFKPDWDPELFLSQNLISHLGVFRAALVRDAGGFREGFEGSQDYDLALRVVERSAGARIRHVPRVLYHWRSVLGSAALAAGEKSYATVAARRAVAEHLARTGSPGEVVPAFGSHQRVRVPLPNPAPGVAVVVFGADDGAPLRWAHEVARRTEYPGVSVSGCTTGATPAAALNAAAADAGAEIVVFVAAGFRPESGDWLTELVGQLTRPGVGIVGGVLLDGRRRVLNAGIVLGAGPEGSARVAGGAFWGNRGTDPGSFGRAVLIGGRSAVGAGCLAVRRATLAALGGFDAAALPGAFFDADLCLRAGARGLRTVVSPYARLRAERQRVDLYRPGYGAELGGEVAVMRERWGAELARDPFYHPCLDLARADFSFAPPARA